MRIIAPSWSLMAAALLAFPCGGGNTFPGVRVLPLWVARLRQREGRAEAPTADGEQVKCQVSQERAPPSRRRRRHTELFVWGFPGGGWGGGNLFLSQSWINNKHLGGVWPMFEEEEEGRLLAPSPPWSAGRPHPLAL